MDKVIPEDTASLLDHSSVKKVLTKGVEQLLFSCSAQKYNRKDVRQDRVIMITDKAFYNMKKTSIKRRIDLNFIKGITTSTVGTEFVLHVPSEYDYRYSSTLHREKIIAILRKYCGCLAIFQKQDFQLQKYTTTRIDKEKQISRMPKEEIEAQEAIANMIGLRAQVLGGEYTKEELRMQTKALYMQDRCSIGVMYRQSCLNQQSNVVTLDDFDIIKVLGRGTFGKVMMVQKKDTGNYYALKSIRKERISSEKLAEHLRMERQVLETIDNEFLVKLKYTFQTNDKIFFIMDFIKGGEIFQHLKQVRQFPESIVKFFAAEVLLALEYLHSKKIIYRDLKPENVLLDEKGHICLTDFGMAKQFTTNPQTNSNSTGFANTNDCNVTNKCTSIQLNSPSHLNQALLAYKNPNQVNSNFGQQVVSNQSTVASIPQQQIQIKQSSSNSWNENEANHNNNQEESNNNRERSNSYVGTPQYLSPEIISRSTHTYSTDVWQLGLFMYELLFGYPPFFHQSTQIVLQLINECRIFFPQHVKISQECQSIIRSILQKDPLDRLTLQQAKSHPWFRDINWELLSKKQVVSPYIPSTQGESWINGFDYDFTSEPPINSVGQGGLLIDDNDKINFDDFKDCCYEQSVQ